MVDLKKLGIIFDIQSLSLHDGPGIRTLIFLKGCALNCLWCANPEGKNIFREVRFHSMNCKGCFACVKACNNSSIAVVYNADGKGKAAISINRNSCQICNGFECVETCNHNALKIAGRVVSVEDIIKIVKRDAPYYRNNGGITLSGGDPVYQHEFSLEILKACKEEYINTAIESAMYASFEVIDKLVPYTDLFLADIKHMDSAKHKSLTGVNNELILSNIARVAKLKQVIVRIPVITGLNDDYDNITATVRFCIEKGVAKINLLPYHKLGQVKYEQLGLNYGIKETQSPQNSKMEELRQAVEKIGVSCVIG